MIKLHIDCDERWPIFSLWTPRIGSIIANCEIPQEIHEKYLKIALEFEVMQTILREYYEKSQAKFPERICPISLQHTIEQDLSTGESS